MQFVGLSVIINEIAFERLNDMKIKKLSSICALHYIKLACRAALLLAAIVLYVVSRVRQADDIFLGFERKFGILLIIWVAYVFEMACRFFPSRLESMGCQKQFARNYNPTCQEYKRSTNAWRVLLVVLSWVALNGSIGLLYYLGIIDEGILVLISLAYGVCDMICILFFCPFQTWMMKNRCCNTCRIYNWDFAMMFTPYIFVFKLYTWSLLGMSLLLLVRWEMTHLLHPERFEESTNASLHCKNCQEKLCQHKTQLIGFIRKNKSRFGK